ncbi:hypothetical protein MWN34_06635 [Ancylobacter sp. 6x-1]|uniref:WGR domain-containing protein n=1 Tax=Ancylobacter crimeensis TaxID=2579147 RepID=A0ABT0D9G1_9HYPH|nr:hypothetical protein [Ancylobacter crimeensis]MCK0196588.1 hypothetical protein [Ancylobacter crimeensis]
MMTGTDFDVVTLSSSTIRVMHRDEHHIYEFSLVDNGCGKRVVSRGPSIVFGKDGQAAAWSFLADAENAASKAARDCGFIDD